MLVLCSNGLSSLNLTAHLSSHLRGCKTSALVVTADNIYKENNYHGPRCTAELEALDLTVSIFDLDVQPAELLLSYDVVEFIGGNPFYLLDSIRKHEVGNILRKIAKERTLIGWSAAAFVFGPSLELVSKYSPEMNFIGLTDLQALKLTTTEVLPHYSKFIARFEHFEEICRVYEEKYGIHVIRLNDGDGIIDDKGVITIYKA